MENAHLAEYWGKKAVDLIDEARRTNDFVTARHDLIEQAGRAIRQAFALHKESGWKDSELGYRDIEHYRGQFAFHAAWLETQKGHLQVAEDFTTAESIYFWRGQDLRKLSVG